jgi:hypothetical protein
MTPEKINQMFKEFRPAILLEAIQDIVHAFTQHSQAADLATWSISVAVLIYIGWVGTARLQLRLLLCGVAAMILFFASFTFSSAIVLITQPGPNPFLNFAAGLFVTFLISPLAFAVALIGVGIAKLSEKFKAASPTGR